MKVRYLVEPVVALYAFSAFLVFPLVQQYVYRRLWVQLTNTSYPVSDNTSRCSTNSSGQPSDQHQEVQRQASLFSLYSELLSTVPSLLVTLLLVSYTDRAGRKMAIVPPLVGTLLYTLSFLAVSYFELNIYFLIGASLLSSLFGGLGTFLGGCFAYIADLCEDDRQLTLRMTGLEVMIGLFSGGAAISTGYFLRSAGFNWPFFTSALLLVFIVLYASLVLEETVQRPPAEVGTASPQQFFLKQTLSGVYVMYKGATSKQRSVLVLLIFIFTSLNLANGGGMSVITLYELNQPLCWTEVLIGYGAALSTTVFLGTYVGVRGFTACGLSPLLIVLLGVLSLIAGMVMTAFAKTTLLMFLVRVPLLLSVMPFPVLRSMMSKLVLSSQQGALFACVSFLQSLTFSVSSALFSLVYAATVSWYPGFSFLLAAGLCIIPLLLMGALALIGVDVPDMVQQAERGPSQDGDPVEDLHDDNQPLLT